MTPSVRAICSAATCAPAVFRFAGSCTARRMSCWWVQVSNVRIRTMRSSGTGVPKTPITSVSRVSGSSAMTCPSRTSASDASSSQHLLLRLPAPYVDAGLGQPPEVALDVREARPVHLVLDLRPPGHERLDHARVADDVARGPAGAIPVGAAHCSGERRRPSSATVCSASFHAASSSRRRRLGRKRGHAPQARRDRARSHGESGRRTAGSAAGRRRGRMGA